MQPLKKMSCALLLCALPLGGCAYRQTHVSQDGIRNVIADLYTEQVMDNLIRTNHNLPVMQLAYSNIVGQVTNSSRLGASGGYTYDNRTDISSIFRSYIGNVSGEQDVSDQISVVADPVLKASIAQAYQDYAPTIKLEASPSKPKPGTYHLMRQFAGTYYFIDEKDVDSQRAFVKLYNLVSESEAPRPSKAFDQLLNEETKSRLNDLIK